MVTTVAPTIGQFNMNNLDSLKDMGYEVDVSTNFDDNNTWTKEKIIALKGELRDKGIRYFNIPFSRSSIRINKHIKSYIEFCELLKNRKYDFIHTQTPIASVISRIAAKKYKIPVIYTAHGFHFFKGAGIRNWILFFPIEKVLSKYTDTLIIMNREDYDNVKKYRFRAKKVMLFEPVGINLDEYFPLNIEEKIRIRKKYGIDSDSFIMFFSGEFSKRKNQKFLIECMPMINKYIPNAKLILTGIGRRLDSCKKLVARLGVEDDIIFTGYSSFEQLVELCQSSDLFVSASLQEGLPKNVKEGMACGLPAVVTDIRGNRDLIIHGKGGLLYRIGDRIEFLSSIRNIYESESIRSNMRDFNLRRIMRFSDDLAVEKMKEVYAGMRRL